MYILPTSGQTTETIFVSPWSPPTLQFLTYTYYTSTYIYPQVWKEGINIFLSYLFGLFDLPTYMWKEGISILLSNLFGLFHLPT